MGFPLYLLFVVPIPCLDLSLRFPVLVELDFPVGPPGDPLRTLLRSFLQFLPFLLVDLHFQFLSFFVSGNHRMSLHNRR